MQRQLGRIAALLNSQGIDIDEIGEVTQVKPTTRATLRETSLIQFSPKWENGPEWPVIKFLLLHGLHEGARLCSSCVPPRSYSSR